MPLRLTPALCILLLAGCASSEPQNVSYAPAPLVEPVASAPVLTPAPPPAPTPQGQAGPFPANGIATPPPAAALRTEMGQFPANGLAAASPGCRTVDNVTLCDVPADPGADDVQYTN